MSTESLEELFSSVDSTIRFARRPEPIPPDLRLSWRISSIVLILSRCREGSATIAQTHVLGWAVRNSRTRETFLRWVRGEKNPDDIVVRFDPSLSRTIDLAIGAGLVWRKNPKRIALTPQGIAFARDLDRQRTALVGEKTFLSNLPRRMSQKYVDEIVSFEG